MDLFLSKTNPQDILRLFSSQINTRHATHTEPFSKHLYIHVYKYDYWNEQISNTDCVTRKICFEK